MKDVSEPYPTAVMADAAKAITKSLKEVLPETDLLFPCYEECER